MENLIDHLKTWDWEWAASAATAVVTFFGWKKGGKYLKRKQQEKVDSSQNERMNEMEKEMEQKIKDLSDKIDANGEADKERGLADKARSDTIMKSLERIEGNQARMGEDIQTNWNKYMEDRVKDKEELVKYFQGKAAKTGT